MSKVIACEQLPLFWFYTSADSKCISSHWHSDCWPHILYYTDRSNVMDIVPNIFWVLDWTQDRHQCKAVNVLRFESDQIYLLPFTDHVSVLGSDDATTCHLVVLRHTGNFFSYIQHWPTVCCCVYSLVIGCSGVFLFIFLYLPGSGAVCLGHCDGSDTWSEIPLIVKAVTSLSDTSKVGR